MTLVEPTEADHADQSNPRRNRLVIRRHENPGCGYRWEIERSVEDVATVEDDGCTPSSSSGVGGGERGLEVGVRSECLSGNPVREIECFLETPSQSR